jgi:hypothetical protein
MALVPPQKTFSKSKNDLHYFGKTDNELKVGFSGGWKIFNSLKLLFGLTFIGAMNYGKLGCST